MRNLRLLLIFFTGISLASLPGIVSSSFHLPNIGLVHAIPAPVENWYPAGPAMDTELALIFTDTASELTDIQQPVPAIDLTDEPIFPGCCTPNLYITSAVSLHRYYDIQFMLANNFWGCDFHFGNSTCGVQIRQGVAHMIDRAAFVTGQPNIAGTSTAIDSPLPLSNGGLNPANPCAWDKTFPQTGNSCIVGAPGGTAYHLAAAAGANGVPWLQAPGSIDLNATAQHFVNAGIATGFNPVTSVLTGISPAAANHSVTIFIRNDDPPRLHLGESLAEQICYLFTGAYSIPCAPYLSTLRGPITAFAGFYTSTTDVRLSWGIYTGSFSGIFPFDASLYFTYNSRFVSGFPGIEPPNGPCASSVPSTNARNYMYLCNPSYDSISAQMEFAPCLTAAGDPQLGSPSNFPPSGGGICNGTSQLSAISAGLQTEDNYGKGAYSIPVFDITGAQFAYLPNWQRVINGDGVGIPNFFTWLNAYSPNPALAGTVRQGFSQTTNSVNPYIAETTHDLYIVRNVYDSLMIPNPLSSGQLINWMTINMQSLPPSALTYIPPPGTVSSFRFVLRNDLFFQDGRKVTPFDIAFSYLSFMATGSPQGSGLSSITGITILGPTQFDINVDALGPFTLNHLTTPTILPGAYWTSAGTSAWDKGVSTCSATSAPCYPAQFTLSTPTGPIACPLTCVFPAALMNVNPSDTSVTFDPIASRIFVGSGPWQCGMVTSGGSGNCSSTGVMNPPVSGGYTLTRFGKGISPASSVSSIYFRSGGNLALWTWTQNTGDVTHDFLNFSVVASCFGTQNFNCIHWMMGIGGCGGTVQSPCTIGIQQIAIVNRFIGINWIAPFNWQSSPPTGLVSFAPIIYEGTITLNPASVAGCFVPFPSGGYDC